MMMMIDDNIILWSFYFYSYEILVNSDQETRRTGEKLWAGCFLAMFCFASFAHNMAISEFSSNLHRFGVNIDDIVV